MKLDTCPVAPADRASSSKTDRLTEPPGPRGLPFLGDLHRLANLSEYVQALFREYGDVVKVPLPFFDIVLINHPDYVNHVLNKHTDRYSHSHDIMDNSILPLGPNALPQLEGEEWKRHRKVMQPPFTEKYLASMAPAITDAIDAGIRDWERFIGVPEPIEFQEEVGVVVMSTLNRLLFNTDWSQERTREWISVVNVHGGFIVKGVVTYALVGKIPLLGRTYHQFPWPHLRRGRANYAKMKRIVEQLIQERVESPTDTPDVLNKMLEARFDDGTGFTADELRSEMIALLFAGFETTSEALSWALQLLVRNPEQLAAAYAEVDALGVEGPIGYEHIPKLPFLRACFDEAQRIQGLPVEPRYAIVDDEIGGYHIAKGTFVSASPWLLGMDPRFWDRPEEFRPRRFLDDEINNYAFLPFGVGPRRCVGIRLAYVQGILTLANMLAHYRYEIPAEWEPKRVFHLSTGLATLPVTIHHR